MILVKGPFRANAGQEQADNMIGTISRSRVLALAAALLFVLAMGFAMMQGYGRVLWHPLVVKITGGTTVEERIQEIEARHPDLAAMDFADLSIVVFKAEERLEVYNKGQLWQSWPLTARSGGPGPKYRAGDGQIPEGIYRVEGLNPNSSYHLSLRINYPNSDDLARAAALGISDPGGDIYIHGKSVSVGCLAIGDAAIERLFYAASRAGFASVPVIIAPVANPEHLAQDSAHAELYARIYHSLQQVQSPMKKETSSRL